MATNLNLSFELFFNRGFRCPFYQERVGFRKYFQNVFTSALKKSRENIYSFLDNFKSVLNGRIYTGRAWIRVIEQKDFKKICLDGATFFDGFLRKYEMTDVHNRFSFRRDIVGNIAGIANGWNIQVSFEGAIETQKRLDFYSVLNYIYNLANKKSNDTLVISLISKVMFLIKYDPSTYTIPRGLLKSLCRFKMRREGDHCLSCKNTCKPVYINNLNHLEIVK